MGVPIVAVPPFGVDQTVPLDTELSWGGFFYGRWAGSPNTIASSEAVPATAPSVNMLTAASALALTLAAPVAGSMASGGEDFKCIEFISTTAYAHVLTATGLLQTGTASVNVATFAAHPGASLRLMAYNGYWVVLSANGITFS